MSNQPAINVLKNRLLDLHQRIEASKAETTKARLETQLGNTMSAAKRLAELLNSFERMAE